MGERDGQDARPAPREQEDVAERELRCRVLGGDDGRDRRHVLGRAAAEEGERDVQRLARDGAPDVLVGGGAERGECVADGVGEVERDEEPEGFGRVGVARRLAPAEAARGVVAARREGSPGGGASCRAVPVGGVAAGEISVAGGRVKT